MVSTRHAEHIKRKDVIPEDKRTPGKDQAAQYIEEEVIEKDRWPMQLSEIADETQWSRQHISNTLNDYFEPAEDGERRLENVMDLAERLNEAYRRGYQDGWRDHEEMEED